MIPEVVLMLTGLSTLIGLANVPFSAPLVHELMLTVNLTVLPWTIGVSLAMVKIAHLFNVGL